LSANGRNVPRGAACGNCSRRRAKRACNPPSHGLEHRNPASNNRAMEFKPTQLFDWDSEPVDERPSEFMSSSGYSAVSGFYSTASAARQVPRRSGFGFAKLVVVALIVLALGALALAKIATLLHA
jgi:hypothetical protein